MVFREWLEKQLSDRQWSPAEAARATGINQSLLSRYLNGKLNPSRQTMRKLSEMFDVTMAELIEMAEASERIGANGVPADVEAAGMPRQFLSKVWESLSPEAQARIVESVRIEVEESVARGDI